MKIVYNNWIPFSGFKAINLFGVLFVRNGQTLSEKDINHERIHTAQMEEMLYIGFYVWYLVEWIIKLFKYGKDSYRNLSFEKEAYDNDDYLDYLNKRRPFIWWGYL